MQKQALSIIAIFFIALLRPYIATANSYVPGLGKLRIIYENTNVIDTRGDFQRRLPDFEQKNYLAFKKEKSFYGELGVGEGISVGYESIYRKVNSEVVITYESQRYGYRSKPPTYVYAPDGSIQLNDEEIYFEGTKYFKIIPISYSWYDNQVFIKKKLIDENSTLMTYHLGYIYQAKGSYFEDGTERSPNNIEFNSLKMGSKAIGGHQINHQLFIRKYFKLSETRASEYFDMDFRYLADPDHDIIKGSFDIGIGFSLNKKNILELKIGFETKNYTINNDLLIIKTILYNKISKNLLIRSAFTRKYAKGEGDIAKIKITAITTGLEFRM